MPSQRVQDEEDPFLALARKKLEPRLKWETALKIRNGDYDGEVLNRARKLLDETDIRDRIKRGDFKDVCAPFPYALGQEVWRAMTHADAACPKCYDGTIPAKPRDGGPAIDMKCPVCYGSKRVNGDPRPTKQTVTGIETFTYRDRAFVRDRLSHPDKLGESYEFGPHSPGKIYENEGECAAAIAAGEK